VTDHYQRGVDKKSSLIDTGLTTPVTPRREAMVAFSIDAECQEKLDWMSEFVENRIFTEPAGDEPGERDVRQAVGEFLGRERMAGLVPAEGPYQR
jgi:hypothetical protein